MNVTSLTAPKWVVSTRTDGEVLTAGITQHGIDLVLLGVPTGFTPAELEGWLGDLGGVAAETSRTDTRIRAIPALLHHSLTGLLFSHAELWERADSVSPCSAAFVDSPEGAAFGWVGEARATLRVDGREYDPQWVRVRDDAGREAHATVLPPGVSADVTLEYWPTGDRSIASPCAIEAEWSMRTAPAEAPAPMDAPVPVVNAPEAPAEPAATRSSDVIVIKPAGDLPKELPTQQPSLASAVYESPVVSNEDVEIGMPVDELLAEQASVAAAMPPTQDVSGELDSAASAPTTDFVEAAPAPVSVPEPPKGKHPVGRWLDRLLGWGRRAEPEPTPEVVRSDDAAPLSVYDSLISEQAEVTPAEAAAEPAGQTQLSWNESSEPTAIPEAVAEWNAVEESIDHTPLVVEDEAPAPPAMPSPATEPIAHTPTIHQDAPSAPAPPAIGSGGLQAAGLAEILLAPRQKPPVLQLPEPDAPDAPDAHRAEMQTPDSEPTEPTEPQAFAPRLAPPVVLPPTSSAPMDVADAPVESMSVISPVVEGDPTRPIEVVHEPVGADDQRFAIPQLPADRVGPVPVEPPVLALPEIPAALVGVVKVDYLTADSVSAADERTLELEPLSDDPAARRMLPRSLTAAQTERLAESDEPTSMVDALRRATSAAHWPTSRELASKPWHQQPWAWGVLVAVLFLAGWMLGHLQSPGQPHDPGPMQRMLRAVGLGGARFEAIIESDPPGAWIAVDGKDLARRTPANIELPPGEHVVTLTLTELGSLKVPVRGQNRDRVTLKESLHGDLEIFASDPAIPISVSVDRKPMGYAPVKMEAIAPGLHEVQFSGPGMPAWAQTVQVGVRQTAQVVAHPVTSPATGIIQVQAQLNDEQGATPLNGAQIHVDGELRGVTPASLELPRGPHSLRLTWRGETAAVQVIDLPGGNERYAQFQFGLDVDQPYVQLINNYRVMSLEQPTVVSATLVELQPGDIREAWLHVRSSEGLWRRYAMTVMKGPNGAVVSSVFPASAFDGQGNTRWYVSAQTLQGDEYFSEIQRSSLAAGRTAKGKPAP